MDQKAFQDPMDNRQIILALLDLLVRQAHPDHPVDEVNPGHQVQLESLGNLENLAEIVPLPVVSKRLSPLPSLNWIQTIGAVDLLTNNILAIVFNLNSIKVIINFNE